MQSHTQTREGLKIQYSGRCTGFTSSVSNVLNLLLNLCPFGSLILICIALGSSEDGSGGKRENLNTFSCSNAFIKK